MAGSAAVLVDGSGLSRLDQKLLKLEKFMALIAGLTVMALLLLAVRNVGGRHLINVPMPGYVDWIEQSMALIAFMGIAYAQRDGSHIRMDILIGRLRGRWLWGAEILTTLLMLGLLALLIWGTYSHFQRSFDFNMPNWSKDCSIDICIPAWPSKLIVPICFGILGIRLLIQLVGFSRAFAQNADTPVAVPLILDAAAQAAAEADVMALRGGGDPDGTH